MGLLPLALLAGCGSSTAAPPPADPGPAPVPVKVTKVVDGDTFALDDGREVRVLGITACSDDTRGGRLAKAEAAQMFRNQAALPVTITTEPGVDTDNEGRLLRYVQVGGADFAQRMVVHDHTSVFVGGPGTSANTAYVNMLRDLDDRSSRSDPPVARACGGPVDTGPSARRSSARSSDSSGSGEGSSTSSARTTRPSSESSSGGSSESSPGGSSGGSGSDGG